jgi:predicted transcriptional regulator of viral defense system
MGRVQELLWDLAEQHHGVITSKAATAVGVPRTELVKLARRGWLEHVGHGVYRLPRLAGTGWDDLAEAVAWPAGRGVLSHATALLVHELADVNPNTIHLTLPVGYRPRRRGVAGLTLHWEELAPNEIELKEGLPVVNPAVAIRQCIESADVPFHLLRQAIKTALGKGRITPAQATSLTARLDGVKL